MATNKVRYGVNTLNLNFTGSSIANVAAQCKTMFSLGDDEIVKVNGVEADSGYIIQDGDFIEFVKNAGTKGALLPFSTGSISFVLKSLTILP